MKIIKNKKTHSTVHKMHTKFPTMPIYNIASFTLLQYKSQVNNVNV